jgi:cell division protease FtsH
VTLDLPDLQGREDILKIHARGKPVAKDVSWKKVARRTVGFSGADLENMLNEAAILAARGDKKMIDVDDLEEAATKVKLGPEKRRLQSDLERTMTAYHEAGHALVGFHMAQLDPVHRISIVSRGMALGFTLMPPSKDRYQETQSRLMEMMAMMLGGRAAEDLVFGELTGGAANDLSKATSVARNMVEVYGMSKLGPIFMGPDETSMTRSWTGKPVLSEKMQAKVDAEIQRILDEAYVMAMKVLKGKQGQLKAVSERLMAVETVDGEEFARLIGEDRPVYEAKGMDLVRPLKRKPKSLKVEEKEAEKPQPKADQYEAGKSEKAEKQEAEKQKSQKAEKQDEEK